MADQFRAINRSLQHQELEATGFELRPSDCMHLLQCWYERERLLDESVSADRVGAVDVDQLSAGCDGPLIQVHLPFRCTIDEFRPPVEPGLADQLALDVGGSSLKER